MAQLRPESKLVIRQRITEVTRRRNKAIKKKADVQRVMDAIDAEITKYTEDIADLDSDFKRR